MVAALTLATWNCFGMAQGVLDALTAARAPYRARLLDGEVRRAFESLNIVCVQEILSSDAQMFFDGLGRARIRDENRLRLRPLTLRGSGLGVAAHHAIAESTLHTFEGRRAGWDRLARKGTLHTRIELDGARPDGRIGVDVLNVHLQSGYDAAAISIRAAQLDEVARRVAQLGSDDRPFIVCGDFNVDGLGGRSPDYELLRRTLPGFDDLGAFDDLPTFDPHPERNCLAHHVEPSSPCQRLDYIFVRPPRGDRVGVRTRNVVRILDQPLRDTPPPSLQGRAMTGAFASDHFGLVATLEIEAR